MGGFEAILSRLKVHYLKGCAALCSLTADGYARKLESESLSEHDKWELQTEIDLMLRDRDTVQLMIDLLERKQREDSGLPPFPHD